LYSDAEWLETSVVMAFPPNIPGEAARTQSRVQSMAKSVGDNSMSTTVVVRCSLAEAYQNAEQHRANTLHFRYHVSKSREKRFFFAEEGPKDHIRLDDLANLLEDRRDLRSSRVATFSGVLAGAAEQQINLDAFAISASEQLPVLTQLLDQARTPVTAPSIVTDCPLRETGLTAHHLQRFRASKQNPFQHRFADVKPSDNLRFMLKRTTSEWAKAQTIAPLLSPYRLTKSVDTRNRLSHMVDRMRAFQEKQVQMLPLRMGSSKLLSFQNGKLQNFEDFEERLDWQSYILSDSCWSAVDAVSWQALKKAAARVDKITESKTKCSGDCPAPCDLVSSWLAATQMPVCDPCTDNSLEHKVETDLSFVPIAEEYKEHHKIRFLC